MCAMMREDVPCFSACDMFEYDPTAADRKCRFTPHTRLKDEPWYSIADPEPSIPGIGIYILQCSTAQENVLTNNEWFPFIAGNEWRLNETTSSSLKMTLPNQLTGNKVSVSGGYSNMYKADVANGEVFELSTTLSPGRFPLGIDNDYLIATNPSGLFR